MFVMIMVLCPEGIKFNYHFPAHKYLSPVMSHVVSQSETHGPTPAGGKYLHLWKTWVKFSVA